MSAARASCQPIAEEGGELHFSVVAASTDSTNCTNTQPEPGQLRREVEVAVIGNGPSSILLSLLLSGYWPYFTGTHPNPYLTQKLLQNSDKSILEQDLEWLSEGLEGRSNSSVALLFDTLLRPLTDIDQTHPSSLRWEYHPARAVPHVVVGRGDPGGFWQFMDPHMKTLSLDKWLELPLYSFEEWKSQLKSNSPCGGDDGGLCIGNSPCHMTSKGSGRDRRVFSGEVAQYYRDYVHKMKLEDNFQCDTEIIQACSLEKVIDQLESSSPTTCLSLTPQSSSSLLSPASPTVAADTTMAATAEAGNEKIIPPVISLDNLTDICSQIADPEDDCGVVCCHQQRRVSKHKWYLRGFRRSATPSGNSSSSSNSNNSSSDVGISSSNNSSSFDGNSIDSCGSVDSDCSDTSGGGKVCVFSQRLVLACGVYGRPRRLDAPGEAAAHFLVYRFSEFSRRLLQHHAAMSVPGVSTEEMRTVLVVGAGLSAADAVLLALRSGVEKVVHVFEADPMDQRLIFRHMSRDVYSGYQQVYRLMQGLESNPGYVGHAQCRVCRFHSNGCTVEPTVQREGVREEWRLDGVDLGGVFVGSNAELGFLPKNLVAKLGSNSSSEYGEINAKHNPILTDSTSFVTEASPSLYAVGSLTGENFVRFGVGSALGVAQHIISKASPQWLNSDP